MYFKRILVSVLCCCLFVSSCTTLRAVPLPADAPPVSGAGIKSGDRVVVTLRDGTSHEIKVRQVEPGMLAGRDKKSGADVQYAFADIQILEVRRVSFWKTGGVIGATLVVIGVTLAAAMIAAITSEE